MSPTLAARVEDVVRAEAPAPAGVKTVLAISYVFPPAAYVGVYRILKYCKYLGGHGWQPIVITPRTNTTYRDERLCDEIPPQVSVIRTGDADPAKFLDRVGAWRRRWRRTGSEAAPAQPLAPVHAAEPSRPRPGAAARIKGLLFGILLDCPDSHLFWVPFVLVRGGWVLATRHVDVVYSTSPPHSSHLAAFVLAKCFRKPYVLDFRDPWEFFGPAPGLMRWLKRLVLTRASRIITVSNGERAELLDEMPSLDPARVEVITNGYDPDDFASLVPAPRDDVKLRLSHVGTIHGGAGRELFDALEMLLREDPALGEWLNVSLVGDVALEYVPAAGRLEKAGVVSRLGFVPHAAALEHAMASDVLLILLGGDRFAPSELPAKLSEYLYIGKPILAVAKPGELWEVLRSGRAGEAVPPGEPSTLAEVIKRLRADRRTPGPDREYIRRFDRRVLTGTFASVLDAAAGTTR